MLKSHVHGVQPTTFRSNTVGSSLPTRSSSASCLVCLGNLLRYSIVQYLFAAFCKRLASLMFKLDIVTAASMWKPLKGGLSCRNAALICKKNHKIFSFHRTSRFPRLNSLSCRIGGGANLIMCHEITETTNRRGHLDITREPQ